MALVTKNFSDIITFTRASTGTYFDSAGVLQSAAINAPRFDYDPSTLAAQGLLIEEARTNSIRNNTMVGAVAGTPGTMPTNWPSIGTGHGVTQEIIGVGTENGINYIDIRFFTATTAATTNFVLSAEAALQIAAANGQSWASSWFVKVIAAPLPFSSYTNRIRLNDSGGAGVGQIDTLFTPTSTLTRYTSAGTIAVATTAFVQPQIRFGMTIGQAYDVTIRIGLPQLEQGAFATSVIPTTTTALTRSADVASVNTLSPWFNATEGTLFAEWASFIPNGTSPGSTYAAGFTDNIATSGAAQLTIQNRAVSNQIRVWQSTTGGGLDDFITPTNTTFQGKAAATYGGGSNVNASANGGAVVTMTNPIQTTAFNALLLGLFTTAATGSGSNYLNGYLRRVTYYPRRLSNAELVSITT